MSHGYVSRLLRDGIGRHSQPTARAIASALPYWDQAWPEPTAAELACQVYRQRWASRTLHGPACEFDVLGLDAADAREVGERRLVFIYGPTVLGDAVLVANDPEVEWRAESIGACMAIETVDEREQRRQRFAARQGAA